MNEFIKSDNTNTTSRTISTEELSKAGDVKTTDQAGSIGIRLKTGIKSGPRVMGRRRRVYHPTNVS